MKAPSPPVKRRSTPPHPPPVSAHFTFPPGPGGPTLGRSLLDLSERGARFLAWEELEPGQEVELYFLGRSDYQPVRRLAEVVWVVPASDGTFCVGARLRR